MLSEEYLFLFRKCIGFESIIVKHLVFSGGELTLFRKHGFTLKAQFSKDSMTLVFWRGLYCFLKFSIVLV